MARPRSGGKNAAGIRLTVFSIIFASKALTAATISFVTSTFRRPFGT